MSPPGIEPRTAYLMHKRSTTELRQLQFCIFTVRGTAMLQSHSLQTNGKLLFSKILFIFGIFFTLLVVVAQWQSACALSKRSWVRFPVTTKFF